MSAADPNISDRTAPVLDWLASNLSADADLELATLVRHLEELGRSDVSRSQLHRCLDLLHSRSMAISRQFRERLSGASLPLTLGLHRSATRLVSALGKLATGHEEVLNEIRHRLVRTLRRNPATISAKALELLGEQLTIAHLAGNSAPYEFWLKAHALYAGSGSEAEPGHGNEAPESAKAAYKYLLAFSAAHPEGLTGREICWLSDFLASNASSTSIRYSAPGEDELGWFWLDPDQDTQPMSIHRRNPPDVDGLLYFSGEELARRATSLIDRLEGDGPLPPDFHAGLERGEAATLLRRVREYWACPPRREHSRRRSQYGVRVCCGLDTIWKMLRDPGLPHQALYSSEWMVVNESPTGYAIMQVTGTANDLNAGMALALRRSDEEPWTLCVVRWIRTETPEQIELGLQVLANSAKPVTVGFRNANRTRPMSPALVLPPVHALGRQQAILAPAGTYSARRFMLVSDTNRLYVAQGRLLSLDMQTAAVELFQYEIDPYPL